MVFQVLLTYCIGERNSPSAIGLLTVSSYFVYFKISFSPTLSGSSNKGWKNSNKGGERALEEVKTVGRSLDDKPQITEVRYNNFRSHSSYLKF